MTSGSDDRSARKLPALPAAAVDRSGEASPVGDSPSRRASTAWLPSQWWRQDVDGWSQSTCAWGRPSVAWFFPCNLVFWFNYIGPMPFVQKLVLEEHPANGTLFWALAISLRGVLTQLASPLLGAASDRVGRKPMQAYSVAVGALYLVPLAFLRNPGNLTLVTLIIQGLGGSPFAVPFAYCADIVPQGQSHKLAAMNARMVLSMNLGFIVAPFACGALFKACSGHERTAWQILLCMSLLNLLYTCTLLPESLNTVQDAASPNRRASAAMRAGQVEVPGARLRLNPFTYFRLLLPSGPAGPRAASLLRQLSSVIFFLYLAKMNVISCVVLFAEQLFDWSAAQAGLLLSIWGLVQFLSMGALSLAGHCRNRVVHDERVIAWIGNCCGLAGMILFFLTVDSWMLFPAMAVGAVSMVTLTAVTGYAGRLVDRSMQGEVQGLLSSVLAATEVLGPPIFGGLLTWGEQKAAEAWWYPNLCFLAGAVSVLVAMACSLKLPKSSEAARLCAEARMAGEPLNCG